MEQQKAEMFIALNAKYFQSSKLGTVQDQLSRIDDSKSIIVQSTEFKEPSTMLIVSIFVGHLGVDRFMLGQTGLGLVKLFTCGGMGIWTIIDWFTIQNLTKESNFEKFMHASVM